MANTEKVMAILREHYPVKPDTELKVLKKDYSNVYQAELATGDLIVIKAKDLP